MPMFFILYRKRDVRDVSRMLLLSYDFEHFLFDVDRWRLHRKV